MTTVTILSVIIAGLAIYLAHLVTTIGKVKNDLKMLYTVAHSKLRQEDFTAKAIPFGYMCGTRDALKKLEEYL